MVAGKVQLELEPTDGVACRHSVLSAEASQSVKHEQLISSYRRHLFLKSIASTGQSGQRVQRASLIEQIERE